MLELRPSCEHCNKPLPADSTEAMICSYECTFCKPCVEHVLDNVCPNCGGGFSPRPVRPRANLKANNYLGHDPASTVIRHKPVDLDEHRAFSSRIKDISPEER
jgi:hypothetical protein